jgi:NTE family protein
MVTKLRRYLAMAPKEETKEPAQPSFSMFEILDASYDATLDRLVEVMLHAYPADIVVQIPRNAASVFEFYRAAELIDMGRAQYNNAITNKNVVSNA